MESVSTETTAQVAVTIRTAADNITFQVSDDCEAIAGVVCSRAERFGKIIELQFFPPNIAIAI